MTAELALLLAQDGVANGAIYVLAALGIVLVFLVTRVVFVPFGDLIAYASLTLAALQEGRRPGIVWLVLLLAGLALLFELAGRQRKWGRALLAYGVLPCLPVAAAFLLAGRALPPLVEMALTIGLILPIAPLLYRIAFRPIADASVLVLLIVAVVLHFAISGIALMVFGPEGARPRLLTTASFEIGGLFFPGQMLLMLAASALATLLLALFFGFTLSGKALRATAVNRVGARLVGIRPGAAGATAFLLASALAAASGILIGPVTTLFYDSGFVIGLKAFVGAIIGGLVSYPGAVLGALFVGLLESFTAFWNSALKEVVVFAVLVPVLILRSALQRHGAEEEPEEDGL
ncbi:branched-chain amino acid ABC transporter permease [Limobrevibacterium gyesilva]|uniref:Branched-chain amino acid ABC transporter permease n=1 Tax=Limobrevibacterium gyesilva TaxID=2991712 RepID=A0AA41YLS1_9PROT|nr:branched-chain amino acid ABC transporter permease [Limobrevibacterium gyesilva]MCW3475809.1 branched-chain amino acid ABC transporter permease [Limobrevibacterium gyesilva]